MRRRRLHDAHELRDCCTERIGTHAIFEQLLKSKEERIRNAVGTHRNALLFYRFVEGLHGTHRYSFCGRFARNASGTHELQK